MTFERENRNMARIPRLVKTMRGKSVATKPRGKAARLVAAICHPLGNNPVNPNRTIQVESLCGATPPRSIPFAITVQDDLKAPEPVPAIKTRPRPLRKALRGITGFGSALSERAARGSSRQMRKPAEPRPVHGLICRTRANNITL